MTDDNDLAYLDLEIQMGMRAQAMGRDQNDLIDKMRALPQALVTAYFSTNYIMRIDDKEVVMKVTGDIPPPLSSLAQPWAIITAYNPYSAEHTETENQAAQNRLTDMLTLHGYQLLPAAGRSSDGNWEEPSILVLGISYEMAKAFGSCFQQNAIVFGEVGGPIELVFCERE
jgi:hypothetical protein